jgi:NAD(P)-dependent dehydrogenase (short-subunit alcohol dehydrogenase family)
MGRLEGKVAVVTGGALGLGKATCQVLAKEGAAVAVADIRTEEGQQLVQEMETSNGAARFWGLDTSSEDQVKQVFSEIRNTFGKIDVLVNNAGIAGANKPTHELTLEEWERVMAVNVQGVFLCTKHVIPYMREAGGGSIINLSSIYGIVGAPDSPPYHASKAAVWLMTKADALL